MTKRYFIRKSHGDLVQEQNRLLETLLSKQDDRVIMVHQPQKTYTPTWEQKPTPNENNIDGFFDLDDLPYIPTITPKSSATLQSVETNRVAFDGESVEKLKKTRATSKLD